jgi:hypothetical protein
VTPEEERGARAVAVGALVCLRSPALWARWPDNPPLEEMLTEAAQRGLASRPDMLSEWQAKVARLRWDARDATMVLPVNDTQAVVALLPRLDMPATWLPYVMPDGMGVMGRPPEWALRALLADARGFVALEREPGRPWLVSNILIGGLSPKVATEIVGFVAQTAN